MTRASDLSVEPIPPLRRYREQALAVPLLLLVADYENRVLAAYRERGFADIQRAHGAVLRHLGEGGATIGVIAARAGITKQSTGQLVRELQRRDYLQISACTADRRRRLVSFSERGEALVATSVDIIAGIRRDYARRLGERHFGIFRDDLDAAMAALAIDLSFLQDAGGGTRFRHFGRMLVELAEDFERRVLAQLPDAHRRRVSRPLLQILYRLGEQGSTVGALAAQLPITVQAVSQTLQRLVEEGLLESRPCTDDSRARRVRLTPAGAALVAAINEAGGAVRGEWRAALGERRLRRLEKALQALLV